MSSPVEQHVARGTESLFLQNQQKHSNDRKTSEKMNLIIGTRPRMVVRVKFGFPRTEFHRELHPSVVCVWIQDLSHPKKKLYEAKILEVNDEDILISYIGWVRFNSRVHVILGALTCQA